MILKSKPKGKLKPKSKAKASKKNVKVTLSPVSDDEWRIKDDARTLKEAMAIKSDPNRLKAAQAYATKEMETLKQIQKMK